MKYVKNFPENFSDCANFMKMLSTRFRLSNVDKNIHCHQTSSWGQMKNFKLFNILSAKVAI